MEGTIGEIRMWACNFSPRSWAYCQSQLLSIAQNTALFSILGTTYGGNGQTTFGLPDFRGRVPIGVGNGPGLSPTLLGEIAGNETVSIGISNLPPHTHPFGGSISMPATINPGDSDTSQGNYPATLPGSEMYSSTQNGSFLANMQTTLTAGDAGQASPTPINNIQPVIGIAYIICTAGIFPSRN